jgi:PKD repeat protein
MAINYVKGQILADNLERDGIDLSISNANVGINTLNPAATLEVAGNVKVGNVIISNIGNISAGNVNINNLVNPVANSDAATKFYVDSVASSAAGNITGNLIQLGTPSDGNLSGNTVAYEGWTTTTYVTDGLDDLNQVALNIANNTFVGQTNFSSNVTSGPSPLNVAFTGTYVGNATNFLWDFGDGNTASTQNPTKTYSNVVGGQFTVTFTAWNANGTYAGNASAGARGSVDSVTKPNYITLFTPLPIASFTTAPTSLDTGNLVTVTNTSQFATSYSLNWGNGNIVDPGNVWTTANQVYNNSANTDTLYNIVLTATNQTAGPTPPYNSNSAPTTVKVYSPQSPAVAANTLLVINRLATSGGVVSFQNQTPGSPGNTASFGAQQVYNYQWGDGTANSNVNIQSGLAGNPSAANITHTFALSTANQANGVTQTFTANLWLYTGFSTSPFKSANLSVVVEPETRANFVGTTANVITDATGFVGNARVGYLYTDYNGANRSTFTFQNTSQNSNLANWSWGDSTFANGVSNVGNVLKTYNSTGNFTVSLTANGTPFTTPQSNTLTQTNYITILPNPTAPVNLGSFTNVTIATASQGTSPLLVFNAQDNTSGNAPVAGTSVTRIATTTPVTTGAQVINANTATAGTLTAAVNGNAAGNVTFTTTGNAVGTVGALVVSADRDLHVANAAVPTGFYKVFSASISNTLASLGTGYNNFQLQHTVSGNTNIVGMVKDNLNSAPTLITSNVAMTEATAGTYRYISGIPYYSATGSPAVTVSSLELQNFTGQTFRSGSPFVLSSGTVLEGSGAVATVQTKSLTDINGSSSMLSGANVIANVGVSTNYVLGNISANINGSNNSVSTLQANIFNVVGTSTTIQLPTRIQAYAGANSGINEQSIPVSTSLGTVFTDNGVRVNVAGFGNVGCGNTPAYTATNFYTSNAWSGAVTIQGTIESVVRYGNLQNYTTNLSTGYLPTGPNLSTAFTPARANLQYFTFAFRRATVANFDIILNGRVSGVWIAAPGTQIDSASTLNGWLDCSSQYAGSGVPGANTGAGGNGSNGCAITGADQIPLGSVINSRYTQTLGSENMSNATGNNVLVRIALGSGDYLTDLQIGVAT